MKDRAWKPPFKVEADTRTSNSYSVRMESGQFFPDESVEAMHATAWFIEGACNAHEDLVRLLAAFYNGPVSVTESVEAKALLERLGAL